MAVPEQDTHARVTELVEEYSTTLYRVAYSVTRNAADAEDVVQETFLRVLRHRNKLARCAITASGWYASHGTWCWIASGAPKRGRKRTISKTWRGFCPRAN